MKGHGRTSGAAALVAAFFAAACGTATGGGMQPASPQPTQTTAETPSTAAIEALYRARRDSAAMKYTPADARFMTGMIGHHAQALVMCRLAPTHAASPSVRTLCARIINSQSDEIALMQRWLRQRGEQVPEVHIEGNELMIHGGAEHAMMMPGMLTPEQMHQLERARGQEFDRLFLAFMIQHHKGAITMVHDLFATDGAGQEEFVFKFANDVQVDQTTEVARMQSMLDALGAQPAP